MGDIREHIYLASLLHDIGKFYQRADTGSVSTSKYLKEHCKTEATYCPLYNGRYTHKHVLWTAQFIEDNMAVFQNLLKSQLTDFTTEDNLINLAAGHHLQAEQLSELGKIIKKADWLSSGMDRGSADALRDAQDEEENSWDSFKQKRMVSILETICQDSPEEKTKWHHMPVARLDLTKDYFPKQSFTESPNYSNLWEEFLKEFKFIQSNTYRAFSETFLNLLQKYTSCIPASTINFADVSLYDHLKTTAALAVSLYDYKIAKDEDKGATPFLLIGADFSGIQPYIYQIVSKYAAKNLKGRSFYLRLLSDTVVRYILKKLNLFQANVIYNSGGGFYLLAPNTKQIKEQLAKAIVNIEKKLFINHGTTLFCAIDSIELSEEALMHKDGKSINEVWGELFELRDKKKTSKFSEIIKSHYETFFNPSGIGATQYRDSITGEEFLEDETPIVKGNLKLKLLTAKQIDLGEALRDIDVLVLKEGEELPYWSDIPHISPLDLEFTYYLFSKEDISKKSARLKGTADDVSVITMNGERGNCDFLNNNGINNIYSLEFYGGNEWNNQTFEEMCNAAVSDKTTSDNLKRLGVLRMDVDNLGHIFQEGILPKRATLSRYAALSRSFDYFFSGYLNTIWREKKYSSDTFIVYSGGDDLFIVGRWDKTIEIAEQIKTDFAEFTCNNPAFSVSCGVSILSPSYPIMKGAEEGEKEEKRAKNHTNGENSKNSISFIGMPLNWNDEYPMVKSLKDELLKYLNDETLPKSFVSKLINHSLNAKIENHVITVPKTYWMLTYDLNRMKKRNAEEVSELLDNCINEVCKKASTLNGKTIKTEYHPLELWAFAARWAELEYRTK